MTPTTESNAAIRRISVCDSQTITTEGVRAVLDQTEDLALCESLRSLDEAMRALPASQPDVTIVDKGFGMQAVLEWIARARQIRKETAVVVWGISITEPEALRYLHAGAKGILRKTAEVASLLACLRAVATGSNWMEDAVFRETARQEQFSRPGLTARELQVMELVEQGLKNKEIAQELGIRPGTVKIHLKHIFEKTGVRGRYGLALSGMRDRQAPRPL
jgi:two-component system, NarL family, nitrate/nitrite response regulator NarL